MMINMSFVNISDNKITIIKFTCFSYKFFIASPWSERVPRTRSIRQVGLLLEYMEAVSVNPGEKLIITVAKDVFNK